ncbi:MAG: hypothetical protein ACLGSD_16530 [Acidobacteriota bacterium]
MNDSSFDSLKPPVTGELDESANPEQGAEIDEAIDASSEVTLDETSLKPPVTG